jgi:hypothetical protein
MKSLRLKNSHGYGEISTKILKVSAPFISSPLNYICIKSIVSGTFPIRLKYSIVKPFFMKGYEKNMTNYRPISLLTAISEVFEKIVCERLLQPVEINNILVEVQFGYRPSASTNNASYRITEEILNALNNRMMVEGIFYDLQKVFDCVNHNINKIRVVWNNKNIS